MVVLNLLVQCHLEKGMVKRLLQSNAAEFLYLFADLAVYVQSHIKGQVICNIHDVYFSLYRLFIERSH